MALNLLDSFGKKGVSFGLLTKPADVIDTDYLSKYFVVSELPQKFTAGRNGFSFNGSVILKPGTEILAECLDSAGNNLFIEMALSTNQPARTFAYKEATAFIFSIHVYNDTVDGVGRIILYGTLIDGRSVKWSRNITIDKTLQNSSKVRFYNRPTLEVESVQVPVLNTDISATLKETVVFSGTVHGLAVVPPKDTNLPTVNRRNIEVDYRLTVDNPIISDITLDNLSINSQMLNASVDVNPNIIQAPLSSELLYPAPATQSYIVSKILNKNTFNIVDPYFYSDGQGNQVVTNINDATVTITYPYISYNTSTSSYLQSNINGNLITMYNSYADVVYRNIRTFSGFLARHRVYRKSLLSNADFSIVADEPLFVNEILRDNLTQNKFYEMLGKFYNQDHIDRYWFTSSANIKLIHSPMESIDSLQISSSTYNSLTGDDYVIVKNDSGPAGRDSTYIPFQMDQFLLTSGSSYDSNFMELKANVQYIFQVTSTIVKDPTELEAKVEFYFTSSIPGATKDPNFTSRHGIKIATLLANQTVPRRVFENVIFFYTPPTDLYGTLIIVPHKCKPYLKDLSFRVYGDAGFSPDVFISRIPWGVSTPNETFQIKAELFDINNNLVYSNLQTVQNFDSSGSSLVPYIPNGAISPGTFDMYVSGNLFVSKSAFIEEGNLIIQVGNLYVPNIGSQPRTDLISASRFLSIRGDAAHDGEFAVNTIVDIGHNDQYLFVATGSLGLSTIDPSNMNQNPALMRSSIASMYATQHGGNIYFNGATKVEERPNSY